jgi:hypothetical protein
MMGVDRKQSTGSDGPKSTSDEGRVTETLFDSGNLFPLLLRSEKRELCGLIDWTLLRGQFWWIPSHVIWSDFIGIKQQAEVESCPNSSYLFFFFFFLFLIKKVIVKFFYILYLIYLYFF